MSAIVFQAGWACGDHSMICGLICSPAMTATVGCVCDSAICSSVPRDRKSTRSELQSHVNLVCRLLLEKKKNNKKQKETLLDKTQNTNHQTVYDKTKEFYTYKTTDGSHLNVVHQDEVPDVR